MKVVIATFHVTIMKMKNVQVLIVCVVGHICKLKTLSPGGCVYHVMSVCSRPYPHTVESDNFYNVTYHTTTANTVTLISQLLSGPLDARTCVTMIVTHEEHMK